MAEALGITLTELLSTEFEVEDESNDEIFIYLVKFGNNTPQQLLDKVNATHGCVTIFFKR